MTKRPLVPTTIRTEFGDVLDSPEFHDVSGADRDLTYVPGFSDQRRARDLELADVASGKLPAHEAKRVPLSVNVRWVRCTAPKTGLPDDTKQIMSGNLGYRVVTESMIGKNDWLTKLPPGATIRADGSIIKGDTMLMVADGATAGRNAARKAARTQRMVSDTAADSALLSVSARKPGTDGFVRKEA